MFLNILPKVLGEPRWGWGKAVQLGALPTWGRALPAQAPIPWDERGATAPPPHALPTPSVTGSGWGRPALKPWPQTLGGNLKGQGLVQPAKGGAGEWGKGGRRPPPQGPRSKEPSRPTDTQLSACSEVGPLPIFSSRSRLFLMATRGGGHLFLGAPETSTPFPNAHLPVCPLPAPHLAWAPQDRPGCRQLLRGVPGVGRPPPVPARVELHL